MKDNEKQIDLDDLKMDKVLAYYDGPLLFVNKDTNENYYLVYCCDVDEKEYVIAQTTIYELIDVLTNVRTISAVFKSSQKKWKVNGDQSIVGLDTFDEMDLLDDNVYLKDLGESFSDYLVDLRVKVALAEKASLRKLCSSITTSFIFNERYNILSHSSIWTGSGRFVDSRVVKRKKQWKFEHEVVEDLCLT